MSRQQRRLHHSSTNRQIQRLRSWAFAAFAAGLVTTAAILFFGIEDTEAIQGVASFSDVSGPGVGNAGSDLWMDHIRDGAHAWGDINGDGCQDLVFSGHRKDEGTRVLWSDCDPVNPRFTDVTSTKCPGCDSNAKSDETDLSALLADMNNDGYVDLIISGKKIIEMYANSGPPNYEFGTPVNTITTVPGGTEIGGMLAVDYNNDGWLDLIFDNGKAGIDTYYNPRNGTLNLVYVSNTSTGLCTTAKEGSYATSADVGNDGDIDLLVRKDEEADFYEHLGAGVYDAGTEIDETKKEEGGVVFADFDNDGDFDFFWTNEGTNQIWRNDGGTFVPTAGAGDGEPWLSAGVADPEKDIEACAAGDVNNDGLVDLFLLDKDDEGYLFLNQTPSGGAFSFTRDNSGIDVDDKGASCSFVDYDNDGDLDLFVLRDHEDAQLWRNDLNDQNYLLVEPRIDLGGGLYRSALGANVIIEDCFGNHLSGIKDVPSAIGRAADAPDVVHFGLPSGPDLYYTVVVYFPTVSGNRIVVEKQILPSALSGQRLIVYNTDSDVLGSCQDFDQDGIRDTVDYDDDNDGMADLVEFYRGDHDGDGTLDYEDPDFCGDVLQPLGWNCADGLPDPSGDWDTDFVPNYMDPDFFACGSLVNGVCSQYDYDGDGNPNHLDIDSDNDGLPDLIESGGADIEGDGEVDGFSSGVLIDTDSDGWYDGFDVSGSTYTGGQALVPMDSDLDGIPNFLDLDSDNDGLTDLLESGGTDTDASGMATPWVDEDYDGFHDDYDLKDHYPDPANDVAFATSANLPLVLSYADADNDDRVDLSEGYARGDNDRDGHLNAYDLDSDNDIIPDLIESGGVDADGDGRIDSANPDGTLTLDNDQDGYSDEYDPDFSSIPLGITGADTDGDGRPESYAGIDNDNDSATPDVNIDTDGDGRPNFLDLDSDDDGMSDIAETGGVDVNGNGRTLGIAGSVFSSGNDMDGDGFYDLVDSDNNTTSTDENNTDRPLIRTVATGTGASDGHPALPDVVAKASLIGGRHLDFDEDGIPNYLDLDSDNDGICDLYETFGVTNDVNQDGRLDNVAGSDVNNNGWHDAFWNQTPTYVDYRTSEYSNNNAPDFLVGEDNPDFDADGLPNCFDLDSDNDGIMDLSEGQPSSAYPSDPFGGLYIPGPNDQDYDGLADEVDRDQGGRWVIPQNTDGADSPDFLDLDSDNDLWFDAGEGHDGNLDGIVDNFPVGADADWDGLDDAYDTSPGSPNVRGSNASLQDEDGDLNSGGDRDWRDLDSTTLPVEWGNFKGQWMGRAVQLNWITHSESNSAYFGVERATDSRIFEEIGTVAAQGFSESAISYDFRDENATQAGGDHLYYRLRQVDLDGNYAYSEVVELNLEQAGNDELNIYPNPSKGELILEYAMGGTGPVQLQVFNESGQILVRETLSGPAGSLTYDLSRLPAGRYLVSLFQGKRTIQRRWVKQE